MGGGPHRLLASLDAIYPDRAKEAGASHYRDPQVRLPSCTSKSDDATEPEACAPMLGVHVKCFRLPPGAALLRDDLDRGATTTGGCPLTYSAGLAAYHLVHGLGFAAETTAYEELARAVHID